MKKSLLSFSSMLALTFVCTAGHAHAQSIDYGSLQSLFGEPVTTSATGTPQRASDVAADMTIITADQIKQSGTRDIPQIINQYVSGVDLLQTADGGEDIGVRGYQQPFQPRMLVLIDGRQVFVDDYSRTIWNNLPVNVDNIRQIEVVKGPASALFGSNAASGVINIITYSPVYDNNNVASVSFGTQNTLQADATATKNGSWGGTQFSVGGLNSDGFSTPRTAADVSVTQPYHRYITNDTEVKLSPTLTATGGLTYSESHQDTASPSSWYLLNEDTTTYSIKGGLGWQSKFGQITADSYLNHTQDYLNSSAGTALSPINTQLIVADVNDQFKVGSDNTVRAGVEFRHKDFQFGGPAGAENDYAANGTWLWQISDALSWTNSLRVDHEDMQQTGTLPGVSLFNNSEYSHAINTWSANSAMVYKLTDLDTFHLSYGRGVQLPSLLQTYTDLYVPETPLAVAYSGNPEIKPTITQSYEFGYDRKINPIHSTAKAATFYQIVQDATTNVIQGVSTIGGTPVYLSETENVGNSDAYGGELELLGAYDGFHWDGSYSLARVTDSAGVLANLDYQGSAPEQQVRLTGGYKWNKWDFDANSQIVSSTNMLRATALSGAGSVASLTPISGYMTVGGRIGYNINDSYTVAVSATSINRKYIDSSPYPNTERQAFLTLTGKF